MVNRLQDLEAIFNHHEQANDPNVIYDQACMRFAMLEIHRLRSEAIPADNFTKNLEKLRALGEWFRNENRAFYFIVDTGTKNDDDVEIMAIVHSLHLDEQFVALHRLVEGSRESLNEQNEKGESDED